MYLLLNGPKISRKAEEIKELLETNGVKYNNIICMGHSGVIVGSHLAALTGAFLTIFRKEKEPAHGNRDEFMGNMLQYHVVDSIIVDDLVCTGDTIREIMKRIADNDRLYPKICVKALVLYKHSSPFGMDKNFLATYPHIREFLLEDD